MNSDQSTKKNGCLKGSTPYIFVGVIAFIFNLIALPSFMQINPTGLKSMISTKESCLENGMRFMSGSCRLFCSVYSTFPAKHHQKVNKDKVIRDHLNEAIKIKKRCKQLPIPPLYFFF